MGRYLIIQCIKPLKDMFVAQAAHIVEYDDMTVENRWKAYTTGLGHFYRKKDQQQLMRCFGNIEDYQLVLEPTYKSYRVVSGKFDDVVSADTTPWPGVAPTTGVAPTIDSDDDVVHATDDDDDDSDSNYDEADSDSNDEETEADSNDEEAEADSNDEEADSDDTDAAKDDEDKYDSDK